MFSLATWIARNATSSDSIAFATGITFSFVCGGRTLLFQLRFRSYNKK
jgi:hypothetical protein